MPPSYLFDIASLDFDHPQFPVAEIEKVNPHRGAMRMLDAVIWESEDRMRAVAMRDVREDEFWVPGHIPGRPLFPGVLQIEAAAQLASFVTLRKMPDVAFMGFAGVDGVKFRTQVQPGDRLVLLAEQIDYRHRRSYSRTQGWVGNSMAFEAVIVGVPM